MNKGMNKFTLINDQYKTPLKKIGVYTKTFPSVFFYSKLFPIILKAALKAKKGGYNDYEWVKSSLRIIEALEMVGVQLSIDGAKKIEKIEEPCVFVSNHMSTLETFVLPAIIHPIKKITFVVKKDLVEYPVFKHIMLSREPIIVGRKNPREDLKIVLDEGIKRLSSGLSIVIFPQTTRSNSFDPSQFNTIGIKLALKADVPIVPIAIKTDAWRTGKIIKDFGRIDPSKKVYFSFGEPLRVTGRGSEEHKIIIQFISNKLKEWSRD